MLTFSFIAQSRCSPYILWRGEQGWWCGKSTLSFSNSNISKKPSNVDKSHVRKSVSLTRPFSGSKKPTWQKRQGSWPVLDCCTPDSPRSSAGTWQTTFWCKKSMINLLLYCSWQQLLYLAAAALPGMQLLLNLALLLYLVSSCYYTWWQLLVYCHAADKCDW